MQVQQEEAGARGRPTKKDDEQPRPTSKKLKWYMIKFSSPRTPEDPRTVKIGLNGQRWEFVRNKDYAIPDPVLEIVRHTEHMVPVCKFTGDNKVDRTQELQSRFSFELRDITEDEARRYWREVWGKDLPQVKETT